MNAATAIATCTALTEGLAALREDFPTLGAELGELARFVEPAVRKAKFDCDNNQWRPDSARESDLLVAVQRINAFDGDSLVAAKKAAEANEAAERAAKTAARAALETEARALVARCVAGKKAAEEARARASYAYNSFSADEALAMGREAALAYATRTATAADAGAARVAAFDAASVLCRKALDSAVVGVASVADLTAAVAKARAAVEAAESN